MQTRNTYGLRVDFSPYAPEIQTGDVVILDPDAAINPGDYYAVRGSSGTEVRKADGQDPGEALGRVMQRSREV